MHPEGSTKLWWVLPAPPDLPVYEPDICLCLVSSCVERRTDFPLLGALVFFSLTYFPSLETALVLGFHL